MKIVICNMGYSGYWAACWRELMHRADVKIFSPQTRYPYASDILSGIPIKILTDTEMSNVRLVEDLVAMEYPDVLIVGGWASSAFNALSRSHKLRNAVKILIIDSSWNGSLRQILARFRLRGLVKSYNGIIVGGHRGRRFARWIGFPQERIFRSIYGYDAEAFKVALESRASLWPRRFCFVGRYAPVKGLDVLLKAYRKYRLQVGGAAWPLDCYGSGCLSDILSKAEGVVDHGFIQPDKLPMILAEEGVFVMPSLHEPWGVALAEAAGAGLPLVCSDMVTSGDDLVRNGVNGYVVKAGDIGQLSNALVRMHESYPNLKTMSVESVRLAEEFSPKKWADRWMEAIDVLSR